MRFCLALIRETKFVPAKVKSCCVTKPRPKSKMCLYAKIFLTAIYWRWRMFVFVTGTYVLVYYTIIIHCWLTTLTLIFCTDMCIKTWILQPLTMNCRSQVLLKSNLCILMNSIVTSHQLFLSFLFNIRHDTLDSDIFITPLTKHTLHLLVAHKNRVEFELYCCIWHCYVVH